MKMAVGLDIGKSSIKYVTAENQGEMPSWLSFGRIEQVVGSAKGFSNFRFEDKDYIVGRDAVLGSSFSWAGTEEKNDRRNLLFCLAILGRLGIPEANMIVGLPVSQASNQTAVNEIKTLLSGRHEITVCGRTMKIDVNVSILAEPLGTYFSLVLAPDGRLIGSSPYLGEFVGIVDIGYRTLDVVALDGGRLATTQDSTLTGVVVLYDQLYKLLEAEYGKLRPNEVAKVNTWLVTGCQDPLMIAGRFVRMDLSAEVGRLKAELSGRIMDEVASLLAAVRPDKLIITGGGAKLLSRELLHLNPRLTMHPQPTLANAIGFYRAAVGKTGHA